MTQDEARKVLGILLEADNGCPVCTRKLFLLFIKQFPNLEEEAVKIWREENGEDSDFRNRE